MSRKELIFLSALLLFMVGAIIFTNRATVQKVIPSPLPTLTYQPPTDTLDKDKILSLTNLYREEHNLRDLNTSPTLCAIADERANELVKTHTFSHQGFIDRFMKADSTMPPHFYDLGENLATNFNTNQDTMIAWEHSPGHNRNLLDPDWTNACISINENMIVAIYGAYSQY